MVKKKPTSAPKAKSTGDGLPDGISVRRYEDADWDEVCKLYWKGACVGGTSYRFLSSYPYLIYAT